MSEAMGGKGKKGSESAKEKGERGRGRGREGVRVVVTRTGELCLLSPTQVMLHVHAEERAARMHLPILTYHT